MSQGTTYIHLKLEIMANGKIQVPGCEPTSSVTSDVLNRALDCGKALVDLRDVLIAIPGSKIIYGYNSGTPRKRWLVLPGVEQRCPCILSPDYHAILKSLARDPTPIEENFDYCDVIGMGYCPSPDFKLTPAPARDPYFAAGGNTGLFSF